MTARGATWCHFISFIYIITPVKKGKADSFVLIDDEVELLLKASTIEYKKVYAKKKMLIQSRFQKVF